MKRRLKILLIVGLSLAGGSAHAQFTDGVVKIGILTDMTSLYSDLTGAGSARATIPAARGISTNERRELSSRERLIDRPTLEDGLNLYLTMAS